MAVNGPKTGFTVTDPNTGNSQDLGYRYVSKDYFLDVYPNLVPGRTVPGVWMWGSNTYGQLGNGTIVGYSSPIQIGSLTNWKQISIGPNHTSVASIKTDNTLWTWGYNSGTGQLGNGTVNVYYSSPIQVGSLTNWKQVSVGNYHASAIKIDGTLWSWGANVYGQLGNNTQVNYSSPIQIGALTTWKQVAGGYDNTNAIKTDGTLWTWGYNAYGQLGNNTIVNYSSPIQVGSLSDWKQVAYGGQQHTASIKIDGTLWTWGNDAYGQLGNSTTVYYSSPIQIGSLTNWKQVACGILYTAAIKTDGTLWIWGRNIYGQLGNNTTVNYSSPIQVGSLTNWKQVGADPTGQSVGAVKTDGTLWAWGLNNTGNLGNNTTVWYSSPIQIGSLTTWKQISFGAAIADGYI